MLQTLNRSLKNRLFVIILSVALIPYSIFLIYVIFLSETKISKKMVEEQFLEVNAVIKLIETEISSLQHEVDFLAQIDILDDLVVEDLDKRLTRLFEKKTDNLEDDVTLFAIDLHQNVISSSEKSLIATKFDFKNEKSGRSFIEGDYLYFYSKIHLSFDSKKQIGFLILRYNLDNFSKYLINNSSTKSYLQSRDNQFIATDRTDFELDFSKDIGSRFEENSLVVYKKLSFAKKEWYLVYAVNKTIALDFLYDFIYFILFLFPFLMFFIFYASKKYAKQIVEPIEKLNAATVSIIETQDYSNRLEVKTDDEIAKLGHSFNKMTASLNDVLQKLQFENELRLQRFIVLIDIFNFIVASENEKECIDISIDKLNAFTDVEVFFTYEKIQNNQNGISIFVSNFEKNRKDFFGSILFNAEAKIDSNTKKFYNSIVTMIELQIDRIRLIKKTLLASNAKSAFISGLSHEFRTPLNSILGSTQYLLTYDELKDEQLDIVANIEQSAHYLLGMVNNILDIAIIEAGKLKVEIKEIDIVAVVQNIYNMLLPLANEKEIDLLLDSSNIRNTKIINDKKIIEQILVNLLSNAIKFTVQGSILIEIIDADESIQIIITDSGIGIAKEDLDRLFEDFSQLQDSLSGTKKGSGLGLSLSKKMAKEINAELILISDGLGKGSKALFIIDK